MYGEMIGLFSITVTKTEGSKTYNLNLAEYVATESLQGFGTGQGSILVTRQGRIFVNDTPAEIKTKIDAERDAWLNAFPA